MPLDRTRCRPLLQGFDFRTLFIEEVGWEKHKASVDLTLKDTTVRLEAIAHKRGFVAWHCATPPKGKLPDSALRRRIEREATKAAHEHLIVFTDADKSRQIWQWVRRDPGQPLRVREIDWAKGQSGEIVLQKLDPLFVSLDDEEALTLLDITARARGNVSERVTRRFFEEFRRQHGTFLKFITGIPNQGDHEWYASVMLNRLMFVYFVQKKGFLDGDTDYLRNRLNALKAQHKGDKFYSFYRAFLLRLFHEGLGGKKRKSEVEKLIGRVPYLNGGIFDVHQLERDYGDAIQIPDKAFEAVFDYFDRYQWHLDERPLSNDNEINPDVLGYIFEKYINQKQMGAYYTKEDITEYIGKNTIFPFLFEKVAQSSSLRSGPGRKALDSMWMLLQENPDRYIYPAVRHGISWDYQPNHPELGEPLEKERPLPEEIATGLDTKKPDLIERRKPWNKAAPATHALPTEIWREVVARRQRYAEVREKIAAGEVREINDFITLNLDIRQFAQDVIQNCEGPDLLIAFWQSLNSITVLDPTGGSGAFIFAALNILEPLYEGCLDRMEGFLAEWGDNGKKTHPNYHKKFTEVLTRVATHPNRRYFVLKSIILNNLYAVDIMEEAVEICKLRLFLKLAALVEPDETKDNYGIEPLPDIDFNIRAGNTLVGYATYEEVKRAITSGLDFDNAMEKIAVKAADLQQTFDKFRQLQTEGDGSVPAAHKLELQKRLKALEDELNRHLAGEYGVKVSDKAACAKWVKSHQPFHWFVEFYGIISNGGFDVVIGNPPYVEYGTKLQSQYRVQNYATLSCGNLHAFCAERSLVLTSRCGRTGLIVPLPSINTDRMSPLQSIVKPQKGAKGRSLWVSSFDERPSNLFSGVDQRLVIEIFGAEIQQPIIATTGINRWASKIRDNLFPNIFYAVQDHQSARRTRTILKIKNVGTEASLLTKLYSNDPIDRFRSSLPTKDLVAYRTAGGRYWKVVLDTPFASDAVSGKISYLKGLSGRQAVALISSSTFWWYYSCHFDMYNLKDYMIFGFRFANPASHVLAELGSLGGKLVKSLENHAEVQTMQSQTRGSVEQKIYNAGKSKPILDEIDTVLAGHYGFTAEELDFILNYDIKYRLGRGAGGEDDA